MASFHYVYILVSQVNPNRHYTGITQDLDQRLQLHNSGKVAHTSKHIPHMDCICQALHNRLALRLLTFFAEEEVAWPICVYQLPAGG